MWNNEPYPPPEQCHAEDHTKQIQKPQAKKIIAVEQAGFQAGQSLPGTLSSSLESFARNTFNMNDVCIMSS